MWSKFVKLTPNQKKIMKIDVLISIIINSAFNMFFTWKIADGLEHIKLFDQPGIAIDIILTIFMITFMTTYFGGGQMIKMVKSGKVIPITDKNITAKHIIRFFDIFPENRVQRGFLLGLILTILLVPTTILLFIILDINSLTQMSFYIFKFAYGIALAFLITPWIAMSYMYKKSK